MKKIIYTLLCSTIFTMANAQTNDIKTNNDFIKKVNNKLSTIKATEYLAKCNIDYAENKPILITYSGKFEIDPSDSVIGCRYILMTTGASILHDNTQTYDGFTNDISVYNKGVVSSLYKKALYVTDLKKYPKQIQVDKGSFIFYELLQSFLHYSEPEENTIDSTTEITSKEEEGSLYQLITYNTKFRDSEDKSLIVNKSVSLQVTNDYLPIKLTYKVVLKGKLAVLQLFNVEKYKLLERIPDSEFSPTLLGKYNHTYSYQGKKKGYVIKP